MCMVFGVGVLVYGRMNVKKKVHPKKRTYTEYRQEIKIRLRNEIDSLFIPRKCARLRRNRDQQINVEYCSTVYVLGTV